MTALIYKFWTISLVIGLFACRHKEPALLQTPNSTIKITILSINDFHGQLDPLALSSFENPSRMFLVGGAEALGATIAELKSKNPDATILLDGGDFMQGSLLSNLSEGAPVHSLYEILEIDAAVLGNHEFDFGPIGLPSKENQNKDPYGALKAWAQKASFPLLAANISFENNEPLNWPNVKPSIILERKGVKIALIGVITPQTKYTTLASNIVGLRFESLRSAVLRELENIKQAKVDVTILMAHTNDRCKNHDANHSEENCTGEIFDLLRTLPSKTFDAVILGHTHRAIWHRFRGTLVAESCSQGKAIGQIELWVSPGKGVDHEKSKIFPPKPICHQIFSDTLDCEGLSRSGPPKGDLILNPLLNKHQKIVAKIRREISEHRKKIAQIEQQVLAITKTPLLHNRHGCSDLGSLFADVLRHFVPKSDFALVNSGGIRTEIPAGPITYGQLYQVFPFDNQIATVKLTGAQVKKLIEQSLSYSHGGLIQVSGLRLHVRCGDPPVLEEITDDKGHKLIPKHKYLVVLSDFLLYGGEGFGEVLNKVSAKHKKIFKNRIIRDEVALYLRSLLTPIDKESAISSKIKRIMLNGPCDNIKNTHDYICR